VVSVLQSEIGRWYWECERDPSFWNPVISNGIDYRLWLIGAVKVKSLGREIAYRKSRWITYRGICTDTPFSSDRTSFSQHVDDGQDDCSEREI